MGGAADGPRPPSLMPDSQDARWPAGILEKEAGGRVSAGWRVGRRRETGAISRKKKPSLKQLLRKHMSLSLLGASSPYHHHFSCVFSSIRKGC